MEKSKASFIPKSPVRTTEKPRGTRRIFVFTYITTIFFFGTMLVAVGIFVWGILGDKQLNAQKNLLSEERNAFNQSDLEKVRELEKRMNTAFMILDRHVSVQSIFTALENTTPRAVQIVGFSYSKEQNNSLNVSLSVSTDDFNSSLFQKNILARNNIFTGSKISKIIYVDPKPTKSTGFRPTNEVTYMITKKLSVSDIPYIPVNFSANGASSDADEVSVSKVVEVSEEVSTDSSVIDTMNQ